MLDVRIHAKQFSSSEGAELSVLQDLEFSCRDRSFTCIVGPSGCGKTTTLRCILGLDTEYDGNIAFNEGMDSRTAESKIAAVFQEPRLLPWRTVEQNVRLALKNADKKHVDKEMLDGLFAELGLLEHREFYPGELSLGLARRVSLARAFAVDPTVLILDEPFVSLDDDTAARLRRLLIRVWSARACTALMVTHNLTEAIELADRILFFSTSPSRVEHEYDIPVPREQRSEAVIQSILAEIQGFVASGNSNEG